MAAQVPEAAQLAAPFALAPALVGNQQPIDYSTRAGQSLYAQATEKLPYVYEGKKSSIQALLQAVRDRSASAGWSDIFDISIGQDAAGAPIFRNLLTQHGEITIDQVRANAQTDYIGQPNRNAQVSQQIYQCLRKSISQEVSDRLVTEEASFYFDDTPDGPSLLATIIKIFSIHTSATNTQLRLKIAEAYLFIAELEYNVDTFNAEIEAYVQKLAANGETTEDLFAHLTRAYRAIPDKEFHSYITARIDAHNDQTATLTPKQLMNKAKSKYDELVESSTYMQEDETTKKLVALTAQLRQMEIKGKNSKKDNKKDNKKRDIKGKNKSKGKTKEDKWKWKQVAPKPNEAKTKQVGGKTYTWCKHHFAWTLHKEVECRLNRNARAESPDPSADPQSLQMVLEQEGAFGQE